MSHLELGFCSNTVHPTLITLKGKPHGLSFSLSLTGAFKLRLESKSALRFGELDEPLGAQLL